MRLAALLALACSLLLAWRAAPAHTGGSNGFATVSVTAQAVHYSLALPVAALPPALREAMRLAQPGAQVDAAPLLAAFAGKVRVSADGGACAAQPAAAFLPSSPEGSARLVVRFDCAAAPRRLTIRDDLFDALGPDHHTLARIEWPGGGAQYAFQPDAREATFALDASLAQRGTASYFLLGVEHILGGWDHLLFVLALILRGGNLWSLVKILTAFTLAHSITLALSALDLVRLPDQLVESVIALSIAWVAAENLTAKNPLSHRWVLSFAFGLMHGFGFSNVLREQGLPAEGLAWSLLGFNLGVEAGQLLVVLLAVPLLLWLRRFRWEPRAVAMLSGAVLAIGLLVFAERAFLGG